MVRAATPAVEKTPVAAPASTPGKHDKREARARHKTAAVGGGFAGLGQTVRIKPIKKLYQLRATEPRAEPFSVTPRLKTAAQMLRTVWY